MYSYWTLSTSVSTASKAFNSKAEKFVFRLYYTVRFVISLNFISRTQRDESGSLVDYGNTASATARTFYRNVRIDSRGHVAQRPLLLFFLHLFLHLPPALLSRPLTARNRVCRSRYPWTNPPRDTQRHSPTVPLRETKMVTASALCVFEEIGPMYPSAVI